LSCDRYDLPEPVEANRLQVDNLWHVDVLDSATNWRGLPESLAGAIEKFRSKYRYILIDCPSLRETQDAVRLAPLADGIILVVEANRTQKDQLLYAERTIESAKGKILGHVLNKRTYVIPDWLSRKMEAIGI
jgi:Mrp family chromosome partitioning ATPase